MLRFRHHRPTTLLLVMVYLTTTAFSGLFHEHDDASAHGHGPACHHEHEHHADEHQSAQTDHEGATANEPGGAPHDDDCSVCRFVGHRPLPVVAVDSGDLVQLSVELAEIYSAQPMTSLARTTQSRAPPLLG